MGRAAPEVATTTPSSTAVVPLLNAPEMRGALVDHKLGDLGQMLTRIEWYSYLGLDEDPAVLPAYLGRGWRRRWGFKVKARRSP